jgi:hypothetical protein
MTLALEDTPTPYRPDILVRVTWEQLAHLAAHQPRFTDETNLERLVLLQYFSIDVHGQQGQIAAMRLPKKVRVYVTLSVSAAYALREYLCKNSSCAYEHEFAQDIDRALEYQIDLSAYLT